MTDGQAVAGVSSVPSAGLRKGLSQPMGWREPGFLLIAGLISFHFLFLTSDLIYEDLSLNYPFMSGDAYDWVANALFYAGHDVRYSARPPLLPLVLAGLDALSALDLFPVLLQLLAHVTILGLYRLLSLDYPPPLAATVTLVWLLNGSWQRLSLDVMADVPAACLLTWAVISWRRPGSQQPGYIWAGFFGGLSAVTQQLALLLPIAVGVTVLSFRRSDLRSSPFLFGTALFLLPSGLWLLWQQLVIGELRDDLSHWSLLRFNFDSIPYYLFVSIAFVGLPAAIGIILGVLSFCRRAHRDPWCAFVLSLQASIVVFFVLFYDFNNLRFLAYLFPLGAVLMAEGLSVLRPRIAVSVALLSLLWSFPFPSAQPTRQRIVLWPAPLTYLEAPPSIARTGSGQLDLSALGIEIHPTSGLLQHNVYSLVARSRSRALETRSLEPESFSSARWGLYFYEAPERAASHTRVNQKLGNLLLKRVHYLPALSFGTLWPHLDATRLGVLDDKALYDTRLPGRDGRWIVATRAGGDLDLTLQRQQSLSPNPSGSAPSLDIAERIAALIGNHPTALFASQGLDDWRIYLPFLVDTNHFFVVEQGSESGARRMLGTERTLHQSGDATLVEHELFGWQWIVVEEPR